MTRLTPRPVAMRATSCRLRPVRLEKLSRSTGMRRITRKARTISRNPCARPSVQPAGGPAACAAPRHDALRLGLLRLWADLYLSHFYGARRTVGYVPFNSETLVTESSLRTSGMPSMRWLTLTITMQLS